jgi:hypothetical protein
MDSDLNVGQAPNANGSDGPVYRAEGRSASPLAEMPVRETLRNRFAMAALTGLLARVVELERAATDRDKAAAGLLEAVEPIVKLWNLHERSPLHEAIAAAKAAGIEVRHD